MAADVERIDVSNARTETVQGRALLVCGYEDDAKCRQGRLEGSIPFSIAPDRPRQPLPGRQLDTSVKGSAT